MPGSPITCCIRLKVQPVMGKCWNINQTLGHRLYSPLGAHAIDPRSGKQGLHWGLCVGWWRSNKKVRASSYGAVWELGEAESLNLGVWLLLNCCGKQCSGGGVRPSFMCSPTLAGLTSPAGETPKPPPTPKWGEACGKNRYYLWNWGLQWQGKEKC